jgi:hypothetical protein
VTAHAHRSSDTLETRLPKRIFTYRLHDVSKLLNGHLASSPPGWLITRPILPRTIRSALAENRLEAEPWEQRWRRPFKTINERRRWHAGRVAYLVKHGWTDPITVEAMKASYGVVLTIHAGNHRLRAACMRGDRTIDLKIIGNLRRFQIAIGVAPVSTASGVK